MDELLAMFDPTDDTILRLEQAIARLVEINTHINDRLDEVTAQQAQLMRQIERLAPELPEWLDKHQATDHFGWSVSTLRRWRQREEWADGSVAWAEGIHWREEPGGVRYCRPLLEDWRLNRYDAAAHQRAISEWAKAQSMKQR
ncbi:MAG TPA: hypothetical protein V6D06_18305, partial [Trichocoleus sp.]